MGGLLLLDLLDGSINFWPNFGGVHIARGLHQESLLVVSSSEVFKSVVAIPQATKVLIGVVWIIMVSVTTVVKVSKRRHGRHHVTARNAFPLLEFEINPHGMII